MRQHAAKLRHLGAVLNGHLGQENQMHIRDCGAAGLAGRLGIAMGQVGHAWLAVVFDWRVPFQVASLYCFFAALAVMALYRALGGAAQTAAKGVSARLSGQEWKLIMLAGLAWAVFNTGYVIYLSFGPAVLEALGTARVTAAGIIRIASWLMILSGTLCGQIVDRYGRRNWVILVTMFVALSALWLLTLSGGALAGSLIFGLIGIAPAGVIMALAGQALRSEVRAQGMGIFFTLYYAVMLAGPPLAGAIVDATGEVTSPLWLAGALFVSVVPLSLAFTAIKSRPYASNHWRIPT